MVFAELTAIWRKPWFRLFIRLAVAALLLALLALRVELRAILIVLRETDLIFLLPALLVYYFGRLIQAYQRSIGLGPLNLRFTVIDLFRIDLISVFYSLIMPGDLIAGVAAWHKLSNPQGKRVEAAVFLVYFRLVNTLVLLVAGIVALWFDPRFGAPKFRIAIAITFTGVILSLLPFVSPPVARKVSNLGRSIFFKLRVPHWVLEKARLVYASITAFQILSYRAMVAVLLLSLATNLLAILVVYLLALAVGIKQPVFVFGWIRSVVSLIQLLPVSVAGLGVREATLVLLLEDYGVPGAQALSLSLLLFAVSVTAGLLGGILETWDLVARRSGRPHSTQSAGSELSGDVFCE
ncbi:lysylphosphatidylglycerol synthase transmembrane domain-containing protein [Chloroflexota bacterium]